MRRKFVNLVLSLCTVLASYPLFASLPSCQSKCKNGFEGTYMFIQVNPAYPAELQCWYFPPSCDGNIKTAANDGVSSSTADPHEMEVYRWYECDPVCSLPTPEHKMEIELGTQDDPYSTTTANCFHCNPEI